MGFESIFSILQRFKHILICWLLCILNKFTQMQAKLNQNVQETTPKLTKTPSAPQPRQLVKFVDTKFVQHVSPQVLVYSHHHPMLQDQHPRPTNC